MTIPARNQHPDTALRETCNAKTQLGTHLAPGAPDSALFVSRGTGTLGTNQGALVVSPGTGIVEETKHSLSSEQSVDISGGDGQPRRDVVYLDGSGSIAVKEGEPAPFAWDETLEQSERTITNAYRPAAPDLHATAGLALATVTVGANAGTLSTGAIAPIRPRAPIQSGAVSGNILQTSLDDHLVPVAAGVGVGDAIDPSETNTPVQDAIDAVNAANTRNPINEKAGGAVLLPAGVVESPGNLRGLGAIQLLGWGTNSSAILVTDTSADGIYANSHADATHCYLDGFMLAHKKPGQQTAGSAIHFTDIGSINQFNIGALQIAGWKGPDPVIHYDGGGAFSSKWDYIRGDNTVGTPFLKVENNPFRDVDIGQLFLSPTDTDPIIDIQSHWNVAGHIETLNAGGHAGKAMIVDAVGMPNSALTVGNVHCEPFAGVSPDISGGVVELRGGAKVSINHIGLSGGLTADHAVSLTRSPIHNTGPGRKRIGGVQDDNNTRGKPVALVDTPSDTSWYWGPASHITYNGHDQRGILPLEGLATTDQLGGGGGVSINTSLETQNRTKGDWYQNTTGKPMKVAIYGRNGGGGRVAVHLHVNTSKTPRHVAGNSDAGDGSSPSFATASAFVPDGSYYRAAGTDFNRWVEVTFS